MRAVVMLVLLALPMGSASAQTSDAPGGRRFRSVLSLSTFIPISLAEGEDIQLPDLPVEHRFPGARGVFTFQITPVLGVTVGGVRLAPPTRAVWAGTIGTRLNLGSGRLRMAPFIEAAAGQLVAPVDTGTYTYFEPGSAEPLSRTLYETQRSWAYGGGGGLNLNLIVGDGFTLNLSAGYWWVRAADGFVDPVEGLYGGVGLGVAFPDLDWYRSQYGEPSDTASPVPSVGPEILIERPAEWSDLSRGLEIAAKTSIEVAGVARHLSGITDVTINSEKAALRLVNPDGSAVRFTGFASIGPGTRRVTITARAKDNAVTSREFEVTPVSADVDPAAAMASAGDRYAVIVGVSDYADPQIPDLQYADDDAQAFRDFLISNRAGLGGFRPENIEVLIDEYATYREIRTALFTFLEQADDGDIVYIFVASHGAPNPTRPEDLYILPHDAEADNMPGTALPMSDLRAAIQRLRARHVVLLTDACHSGGVGLGAVATRAADPTLNAINQVFLEDLRASSGGLAVFTASEARQLSIEGEQWGGGHGVFTYHLLQGLAGAADTDDDSIVRLGELFEYVRDAVRDATGRRQIPSIASQSHDRYLPVAVVPR